MTTLREAAEKARAELPMANERETVYCSVRGDHLRTLIECADAALAVQPQAEPMSDQQIEAVFQKHGARWNGSHWIMEDADLHPFVRSIAAPAHEADAGEAVPLEWRKAVMEAYGHLWHINTEPLAPIPLRSPEQAAYEARKCLRELLTTPERGEAINAVGELIERSAALSQPAPKEPQP